MKIAIIGGGSLGLLFSYYLSLKNTVTLYTRTQEQSDLINENGIHIVRGDYTGRAHELIAAPIEMWQGTEDLTIVAVKQYQLPSLLPILQAKASGNLLFLQNGYGHIRQLSELSPPGIFVGSVEHGAVKANPYTVYHNGLGVTRTAVFNGNEAVLKELSSAVPAEFPFVMEPDYEQMLMKKLVVNSVINPLTATLKVKNGALIQNSYFYQLFTSLFDECAQVLELTNKAEYFQNLLTVCEKTADNHSSMYKDLENGRQTEIDAILGYLLERSAEKNIKAPLIHNYYYCIKGKEHEREGE
ncbi:2-dehydropantoate 2-reductase [Mesobacillus subterraneus]|uniref:2-dehydropantoate 2-reductase n=1 Tax=Mesobacillus subterraneus TaxID=285983 RepID=A0A3R9EBG5_9BACI|nr:2-dehydropantoate 2-reductase [Mesobacillus subterraneus]RSD28119.1 2-dehydropantoate 2-reductase [Mesobacillus subterraneus]